MDLNRLYRAIPEDRELRLSRRPDGIWFEVVDFSRGQMGYRAGKMISGTTLLRVGADVDSLFLDQIRILNTKIDREITNG